MYGFPTHLHDRPDRPMCFAKHKAIRLKPFEYPLACRLGTEWFSCARRTMPEFQYGLARIRKMHYLAFYKDAFWGMVRIMSCSSFERTWFPVGCSKMQQGVAKHDVKFWKVRPSMMHVLNASQCRCCMFLTLHRV